MHVIDPFSLNQAGGPDRASAYFRAVCCVAGYRDDPAMLNQLVTAAGGLAVHTIDFPIPVPNRVYVCAFPSGSIMVLINGTTSPQQYIASVLGAPLAVLPGWRGRVHSFFGATAISVAAILSPFLTGVDPSRVIYVGHSLGGAVAALLASRPQPWTCVGAWSIGQPRCGDGAWADQFSAGYERWTTPGDPVPLLPPSINPLVGATLFPGWGTLVSSYTHGGHRWQVFAGGLVDEPAEAPSWDEAAAYLATVAQTNRDWVGAHASTSYACRIRRGIPVAWQTDNADWPGLRAVDLAYATALAGSGGRCPNDTLTTQGDSGPSGPFFARQGRCG